MNSKSNNNLAIVMMAAGFLLLVLAWNGAAGFDTVQQQFPYLISGGLGGLGLIGGGIALLMIQETRRGTAQLERKLDEVIAALGTAETAAPAATKTTSVIANGNLTERQRRALERAGAN